MKKEHLQLEEELGDNKKDILSFEPRRIARIAIFIALSAVGALVKVPSPTGTVALDSCPGYFSAITFGVKEGCMVAALGHILTAAITGFPLGLPTHLYISMQMAIWVTIFSIVAKRINLLVGAIAAVFCNGVLSSILIIPIGGLGLAVALILPLAVGSTINVAIACVAYLIVHKSNIV